MSCIREWIKNECIEISNKEGEDVKEKLIKYVEEKYKEKIAMRKRNEVEEENRCKAKRSDGTRCSRRKLDKEELCGTHRKGKQHGLYEDVVLGKEKENKLKKIVLKIEDVNGIMNYVDEEGNMYNQEDIKMNKSNARIIGRL